MPRDLASPRVPPLIERLQRRQLAARRALLDGGAGHVGWKVALGMPGADEPLFGYLTSATRLRPGATFDPTGIRRLQVDCELAVELARDLDADETRASAEAAIGGVATALELCDVAGSAQELEEIVAADVYHRAFAFGPFRVPPRLDVPGRVTLNGEVHGEGRLTDAVDRLLGMVRLLETAGERLRAGDRIICGAICSAFPGPGDEVEVEVGDLGAVRVQIG